MRIGLISDTEGNIAALEAAVSAMRAHAPDVLVFAGDVLECPFSPDPPADTIALLRAEDIRTIPGNHDRYLMDWGTPRWPHTLWMRQRRSDPAGPWLGEVEAGQALITPADLDWLRGLPEEFLLTDGVWVCHGMPGNPWNSIWPPGHPTYDANVSEADRDASLRMLADLDADLVLCGHVPEPWTYVDRLPDGRDLRIVRAGPRTKERVGYAMLTGGNGTWDVTWHHAEISFLRR